MEIRPKLYDRLAVAAIFGLVILPVLWRGVVNERPIPGMPRLLDEVQGISCLFSERPNVWHFVYIQVRRNDGRGWVTVEQSDFFPLEPFGHRTRLHRFLLNQDMEETRLTKELAVWFYDRWPEVYPGEPVPLEVRFAYSYVEPRVDRPPEGKWEIPEWSAVPLNRREVIASYRADTIEHLRTELGDG